MPNLEDFPGVCLSCVGPECKLEPGDLDSARERVNKLPTSHYSKTLVTSLKYGFPDKFSSEEEAYLVFDAMKAVIANGLKNKDVVGLEGLGEFRTEKRDGRHHVIFTPERVLEDVVNE